jgi:hypothetical protein
METGLTLAKVKIHIKDYDPKKKRIKLPSKKEILRKFRKDGQAHPPVFQDLFELSQYVWDVFHAKLRNVAHIFKLTKEAAEEMGEDVLENFRQALTTIHAKRLTKKAASIGRECDNLLEHYPELLAELKGHDLYPKLERIWEISSALYRVINFRLSATKNITEEELKEFISRTDEYFDTLLAGWGPAGITPYVHLVCEHSKEFFEIYHNLGQFSTQGFEHKNKVLKRIFRRHTNQGGGAPGRKNWQAQAIDIETTMIEPAKVEI